MHSYTLTTAEQKEKLRKQSHLPVQQKNKVPGNKPTLRRQKIWTQKTIGYWWKKSMAIHIDGDTYQVLGLEESILWKLLYYPKQSTDSI